MQSVIGVTDSISMYKVHAILAEGCVMLRLVVTAFCAPFRLCIIYYESEKILILRLGASEYQLKDFSKENCTCTAVLSLMDSTGLRLRLFL